MRRFYQSAFLLCGILLMFAARPVFAQEKVTINKQPTNDFVRFVKDKIEKGEVDLTQPFKVVAEGALTAEGKLDTSIDSKTKKPKSLFTTVEGDEKMVEVAKIAIEAVSDSGWLGYLKNLGAEKVKLTFAQDKENVIGIVESEAATAEKAGTMASGFNVAIKMAQINVKDEDDKILLSGLHAATVNEKIVTLNFALPRQTVQEMIMRNLKKALETEKTASE